MTTAEYFFDDGQSRKFWAYTLRGKKQTLRYGRLGTEGRRITKEFPSPSAAKASVLKLVDQKVGKGYVLVDPGQLKITRPKRKRAATEKQVSRLEQRLGASLPDDYRHFLLTQNGGEPEPDHISIPEYSDQDSLPVGFLYGLYSTSEPFESLLFAVDDIQPCLPEGHLPICGLFNLHYYSISLQKNRGCVYYWNEDAGGYDVDEDGRFIFDDSHAILVAGSFNEFLTRIAIHENPDTEETASPVQADQPNVPETPELRSGGRLSKKRRKEIMRLVWEGDEELTEAITQGEKATEKYRRRIRREIGEFLKMTTNKDELQYFAENWNWDSGADPMLELVKNPNIDAGTLLQIYWYGCPEDYYLFHKSLSDIDSEFDRCVFRVLRHVERRMVKADYKTASIAFDPTDHVSMSDRRDEFARQIPDIMYEPISGRSRRRKR